MKKVIIVGSGLALCAFSFIGGFNACRKAAIESITDALSSEETKNKFKDVMRSVMLKGFEKYKREDGYFIPLDEMF